MKAQILKIAKVKSEEDFYKKFPTEESFMKAYGKEFKKAQMGASIQNNNVATIRDFNEVQTPEINESIQTTTFKGKYVTEFPMASWDGMVEKADGTMGMWGNPIPIPKQPVPNFIPKGKTLPNLTREGDRYQGNPQYQKALEERFRNYQNGGELEELTNFTNYNDMEIAKSGIHIKPSHKGLLHKHLGIAEGKKIPASKLAIKPGDSAKVKKQKQFALNARKFSHQEGGSIPFDIWGAIKQNKDAVISAAGDTAEGLSMLKGQKYNVDYANQMSQLTNIQEQAMNTREEPYKRNYVRPEDIPFQPNQMFPSYGTGSNILSAKDGIELKNYQNGGQEDWYNDRYYEPEYEPLMNPIEPYVQPKRRKVGDILNSGKFGDSMDNYGNDILETINPYIGHVPGEMPTAGNKIGGGVGQVAGTILAGPLGGTIGKFAGNLIGGAIDQSDNKIRKYNKQTQGNINDILGNYVGRGIQRDNRAFMENGGDMAMGGQLQAYEDGGIETISENPYLPNGGATVQFQGASHADGGIPITYGNSPVEVEGGEPAVKLDDNLVVFGNLKIPNEFIPEIGDPSAKGKKFKNYVKDLSKIEKRQNNIVNKSIDMLNELTPITSFDKLKLTSLEANIQGANMKLKDIAGKKEKLSIIQKAINDTAEEYSLDADSLAMGKYKKAKNGMNITAQAGITKEGNMPMEDYVYFNDLYRNDLKKFQTEISQKYPDLVKGVLSKYPVTNYGKNKGMTNLDPLSNNDGLYGERTAQIHSNMNPYGVSTKGAKELFPQSPLFSNVGKIDSSILNSSPSRRTYDDGSQEDKFDWMNVLNQALPYLRPSNDEPLDNNQLLGELYALSNNQLEPVDAQGYSPELSTPYDISLQDILNSNQADFNSIQRIINSPEAISALAAQKYEANAKTLGEQMRINQGEKQRVYEGNRALLNNSKLKNLSIYDNQYTRQAQAKSNTKAITQQALNSISSKIAQNKLENKTLQTYENLYNYRYDNKGRAINMNPLQDFQAMIDNASSVELEEIKKAIEKKSPKEKARNGSIVKMAKNL